MRYKGILLDLDHTLYHYPQKHTKALHAALALLSKKSGKSYETCNKHYTLAREKIHQRLRGTASSHNRLLYFQEACEAMKINPLRYAYEASECYWDNFLKDLTIYPDMYHFLDLVKEAKICLITDLTADIQFRKIRCLQLTKYLDCLVTSEEAGVEKPHPFIFRLALKKLGLKRQAVAMIGDDFHKDIVGAVKLKIASYWLNFDQLDSTYKKSPLINECRSFAELIKFFS